MTPAPELTMLVTSAGVGVLMALSGVHKNALEWRRRRRRCPSCGRLVQSRCCACSAR